MIKNMDNENSFFLTSLHLFLVILAWCSWFLFNWVVIVCGVALYYTQLMVFGDCILTKAQFKDSQESFHDYILRKCGVNLTKTKVKFLTDYVFPWIILGSMVIWQLVLHKNPILA